MDAIAEYWSKTKSVWITIFILFAVTRSVLGLIAWRETSAIGLPWTQAWKRDLAIRHPMAGNWAVWDSEWYLKVAENGYADSEGLIGSHYSSIGFFPLYPFLISALHIIVADYLIAGIIISNLFLLLAAYLLYGLVNMDYGEKLARRSLWYLFLFPSAYIFSSVYPESLLLFLWLAAISAARREHWFWAGIAGFLAVLTKPIGILIIIPVIWFYIRSNKFSWRAISLEAAYMALIPLGLVTVGLIGSVATGDALAYVHVQSMAWGHHFTFPLTAIIQNLFYQFDYAFNSLIILALLILLALGYKKISLPYWIFAVCAILFGPATGLTLSSWRYAASVFPLLMLLAIWPKSDRANDILLASMGLVQVCLFIFWVAGFYFAA